MWIQRNTRMFRPVKHLHHRVLLQAHHRRVHHRQVRHRQVHLLQVPVHQVRIMMTIIITDLTIAHPVRQAVQVQIPVRRL